MYGDPRPIIVPNMGYIPSLFRGKPGHLSGYETRLMVIFVTNNVC
jgi:hypothetical protein